MSTTKQRPTRSEQWTINSRKRRQALKRDGGGQFFALLDGEYMGKVNESLEWRDAAWRKNHGRPINKTDLLKLMIDADVSQIKRRQRATARRNGRADAPPSARDVPAAGPR